jgi:hypothetical protein
MFAIALLATALAPVSPVVLTSAHLSGGGEEPTVRSGDDDEIERALAQITSANQPLEDDLSLSMFIKVSYAYSSGTALLGGDPISRMSIDDLHLNIDGEFDHWMIHVGLRGEQDSGFGFFGDAGTLGNVRAFDILLSREFAEDWFIRAGQFRPPFLGSSQYEDSELIFVNRTFNGEVWDFYDQGAVLQGKWAFLRGWASMQNGIDNAGNQYAFTARGMIDVLGEGAGYEHEGALGAPPSPQLSIGAAAYYDQTTTNASSQSIEGHFTWNRFCAESELVDNGNGLGDLYSWGTTASFLITDTIEIAARYEAFRRNDDSAMWRFGVDKYIKGHEIKWQAELATATSHAPRADTVVFQLGFVLSL